MSAIDRKIDYRNKETDLFISNFEIEDVEFFSAFFNIILIFFTNIHLISPYYANKHVFLIKHPYFKFLPVSPGFCRLKLAGLNRFLPAGLNFKSYAY